MTTETMIKFKYGDTVCSKKTGLPAVGTICGMAGPDVAKGMPEDNFYRWTSVYPDWRNKFTYYVKYNSPQKPLSFEEMVTGMKMQYGENFYQIPQADLLEIYKQIPLLDVVSFPEDDLEPL